MDIISRGEWGARSPRGRSITSWGRRTEFVVHYSEGPTDQSVRSIQGFHMNTRGWADIGYNFLVDISGRIHEGRGWLVVGAHAPGHNTSGIGVCMIGRNGDATAAAKRSIRWLYDEACRRSGRTLRKLGHRDVYPTSCPGDELYAWVRDGMPADLEDDMQLDDQVPVGNYYDDLYGPESYPVGFTLISGMAEAKMARQAAARIEAAVAKLAQSSGVQVDVDENAIVAGILAGLTPERIAAAIPRDIGEQVAEELAARLAAGEE